MAIKEFWIQIENRLRESHENRLDFKPSRAAVDVSATTSPTGFRAESLETKAFTAGTRPDPVTVSESRIGDGPDEEFLILRRYRSPRKKDLSDAWSVPHCADLDSSELNDSVWIQSGALGIIRNPVIEFTPGDEIIVQFRNNDQRKRIISRMIEVDMPFGGPIQLPTPFSENLRIEDRIHNLYPFCVDLPVPDRSVQSDPNQPVGSEASLWREIGVILFKNGDRVPPGGTFTYIWNTCEWIRQPNHSTGIANRCMTSRITLSLHPVCS
jgi:hypothetical protein